MRALLAAGLIAVLLLLFAAPVEQESKHAEAETHAVLIVEAECPCSLDGCAHDSVIAHYDHVVETEAVLKLPIETAECPAQALSSDTAERSGNEFTATTMSTKLCQQATTRGVRRVLKLPHYESRQHTEDTIDWLDTAAIRKGTPAAGVLA